MWLVLACWVFSEIAFARDLCWVSGSTGSCTIGSASGSTLGCDVCTLGDDGFTLGDGCCTPGAGCCAVGDRRSSHLSFIVGTGGGGRSWALRVVSLDYLPSAFCRAWIGRVYLCNHAVLVLRMNLAESGPERRLALVTQVSVLLVFP